MSAIYPTFSTSQAIRSLTVDATAGGVSPTAPTNISGLIYFDVQDADVYATFDGSTAPVSSGASSVGHRFYAGKEYTMRARAWTNAKFIRQGATSARIAYSEADASRTA